MEAGGLPVSSARNHAWTRNDAWKMTNRGIAVDAADLADTEQLVANTRYQVANAPRREWPFPHLLIDGFLDRSLFEAVRALDAAELFRRAPGEATGMAKSEENRFLLEIGARCPAELSAVPVVDALRAVLSHDGLTRSLMDRFRDVIAARVGNRALPIVHGLQFIEDRAGYSLAPHTDTPQKLITLLIYLADDDDEPELGTQLYALRKGQSVPEGWEPHYRLSPSLFVRAHKVPYRPNVAVVFAPGMRTFHGVEAFPRPGLRRRLLQAQINLDTGRMSRGEAGGPVAG